MKAFRKSLEAGITGVEFDVWLTSDDILIVVHGGNDGELPEHLGSAKDS